jgi:hypothetical protein
MARPTKGLIRRIFIPQSQFLAGLADSAALDTRPGQASHEIPPQKKPARFMKMKGLETDIAILSIWELVPVVEPGYRPPEIS